MNFNLGDFVTRKSYKHDILFKIIKIEEDIVYLKGVNVRLLADAPITDVEIHEENIRDDFNVAISNNKLDRDGYFYLPGKVLHLDGDGEYLDRCLKFYKENKIYAIGKKVKEENMSSQVSALLNEYKPDILVITGHDAYNKKAGDINNINNYKNSNNFVKTVKAARKYEKSHEKLIIISGACQSDYEELIKAGSNFASSPKRINIHALDPAIIATTVAITERNKELDLINLLNKTKYGPDGMGGLLGNGVMYVGFPR
ncbi:MAG: sporulation peptidase YabG [Bacilli bacterium]|nr:sporulation peptidase YabG [Bacilli bacterium]